MTPTRADLERATGVRRTWEDADPDIPSDSSLDGFIAQALADERERNANTARQRLQAAGLSKISEGIHAAILKRGA